MLPRSASNVSMLFSYLLCLVMPPTLITPMVFSSCTIGAHSSVSHLNWLEASRLCPVCLISRMKSSVVMVIWCSAT